MESDAIVINPFEMIVDAERVAGEGAFAMDKIYDETDAAAANAPATITLKGANDDDVIFDVVSVAYTGATVDTNSAYVTLELADNELNKNYVYTSEQLTVESDAIVINPFEMIVPADRVAGEGAFAMDKIYDANTDAADNAPETITLKGANDDDVIFDVVAVAYTDKNVGVDSAYVTLKLADNELNKNYIYTSEQLTVESEKIVINLKELTVEQSDLLDHGFTMIKIYDANTDAGTMPATVEFDTGIVDETILINILPDGTSYAEKNVGVKNATIAFELADEADFAANHNYKLLNSTVDVESEEAIVINELAVTYTVDTEKYYGQLDDKLTISLPENRYETAERGNGEIAITYASDAEMTDDEHKAVQAELNALFEGQLYDMNANTYELKEIGTHTDADAPFLKFKSEDKNYSLTSAATIVIKTYTAAPAFQYAGVQHDDYDPWFKTTEKVTITEPSHFIVDETGYDVATNSAENWLTEVSYEQVVADTDLDAQNDVTTTRTVYLRNSVEGEYYMAIDQTAYNPEYKHDPAYHGDVVADYTNPANDAEVTELTTRSTAINLTVDEASKIVVVNGDKTETIYPTADGTSTNTLPIGNERAFAGTDILGNAVEAKLTGFAAESKITYLVNDMAGNYYPNLDGTPVELTVAKYAPKALDVTFEGGALEGGAQPWHLPAGNAITFHGQPGEMITIKHTVSGQEHVFNAVLDANGQYVLDLTDPAIEALFNPEQTHIEQQFNVVYTDAENLDAEAFDCTFVYDTGILPIVEGGVVWENRSNEMKITLPEYGTLTQVEVAGAVVAYQNVSGKGELTLTVDLNEPDLSPKDPEITVTYADALGNTSTAKFTASTYTGSALTAIFEPVLLPNDYFDARKGSELKVTIAGTEYEDVIITLEDFVEGTKLSGDGEWEDVPGTGTVTIPMKGMPREQRLVCKIVYEDINGASFEKELWFDDECETPVITSPIFEYMTTLTGKAEPNSAVYVIYDNEVYTGTVDESGYFEIVMPGLWAGETFDLHCVDIAYNRAKVEGIEIPALEEVETQAYPMGRMVADFDSQTWYMATEINTASELPVTVPVLAGGSFEIGTCTYTVANGKVNASFDFSVDEENLVISDVYTGVLACEADDLPDELPAGALSKAVLENNTLVIDLPAAAETVCVVARLDCVLYYDYVQETYQSSPSQHASFLDLQ